MINSNSHATRLPWIDIGRGIAMFLVVLFHCENAFRGQYVVEHYSAYYHSFFLPLFFFLVTGLNATFKLAAMPVIVLSCSPLCQWILAKYNCERASKYASFAFVLYASHAIFGTYLW